MMRGFWGSAVDDEPTLAGAGVVVARERPTVDLARQDEALPGAIFVGDAQDAGHDDGHHDAAVLLGDPVFQLKGRGQTETAGECVLGHVPNVVGWRTISDGQSALRGASGGHASIPSVMPLSPGVRRYCLRIPAISCQATLFILYQKNYFMSSNSISNTRSLFAGMFGAGLELP